MTERTFNVLFLCTGNSARSILAESILRKEGTGRFNTFSAGSTPRGSIHPLAIDTLTAFGYPVDGLRSKSWNEFEGPDAPVMDFIFTVCDAAAGESCPVWPGHPMNAHWGITDPSDVTGSDFERRHAFVTALRHLRNRITAFTALPLDRLDTASLRSSLQTIGRTSGASAGTGATPT